MPEPGVAAGIRLARLTAQARLGDLEGARNGFMQVEATAARAGDRSLEAAAMVNLGVIAANEGEFDAGLEYSLAALQRFRELGEERAVSAALLNCGWSALRLDPARAEDFFRQGLTVAGPLGGRRIASGSLGLAAALLAQHDEEQGAQLLGAAAALRDELGIVFEDGLERETYQAAVDAAKAGLGEEVFAAAWARGEAMSPTKIVRLYGIPTSNGPAA